MDTSYVFIGFFIPTTPLSSLAGITIWETTDIAYDIITFIIGFISFYGVSDLDAIA